MNIMQIDSTSKRSPPPLGVGFGEAMRKGTDKDWEQRAGCMTFPDAVAKEPVGTLNDGPNLKGKEILIFQPIFDFQWMFFDFQ